MAERYPAFRAGQKATGALLASMQPLTVRKVADTARTVDTNSADPELQITVEANAVYTMTGQLYAISAATGDNINIAFTVPTGSDGTWGADGLHTNAVADNADARMAGYAFNGGSTERGTPSTSAATPSIIQLDGLLIVGSTAGTLALSWAVGVTPATTTLQPDSYLILQRIA